MIYVRSELKVYEVNEGEAPAGTPPLLVKSHWNVRGFVVLEVEGKRLTVVGSDLRRAIENAENKGNS